MREECRARRIEIDADVVDSRLDDGIKCLREFLLVDVMLILADADGLRVDFDELGQRILHAARDGDSAADGDVVLGQFFLCELRSRVDGGTGFVRNQVMDVVQMMLSNQVRGELFGFIARRAVANREQRDMVLLDECEDFLRGGFALGIALRELEHAVAQDAARRIDDGHLAARAVAGVEAHDDMAAERRLQEQLPQVHAEDMDGLRLSVLCELRVDFAFERGEQQAVLAVFERRAELVREDAFVTVDVREHLVDRRLVIEGDLDAQAAFLFPAVDGEHAVRRQRADGLAVVRVHQERLRVLGLPAVLVLDEFCLQRARLPELLAQLLAELCVFTDDFGDDVARACESVFSRLDAFFSINESGRGRERRAALRFLRHHRIGERPEPFLACHLCPRAALLLVRQVEVFELLELRRAFDGGAELGRQLALLVDFLRDFLLPLREAAQVVEPLCERPQLLVLERPRRLLAIARDERHRIAVVEQLDSFRHLLPPHAELARDDFVDI